MTRADASYLGRYCDEADPLAEAVEMLAKCDDLRSVVTVELEACNDDELREQCAPYRVTFHEVRSQAGRPWNPIYAYTATVADLAAFLADVYNDGSGEPPLQLMARTMV